MAAKAKNVQQDALPVYVISGKDKFLVGNSCSKLIDKLVTADERAMALYQPDDGRAELADVLDELRTLPFLAKRRVVLIKGADKFVTENRSGLEKYFDDPASKGVLVMTVDSWPGNTKLAKKLKKMGEHISQEVKPWELANYAVGYATSEHGKKLSKQAAGLLVEFAGDDPGRICGEIDKLAVYAGKNASITPESIEALVGHNRMFNVFAVIDAMTSGNRGAAIERLRNMFANDKNAEFSAVGAFAFHFRKLFNAKVLLEKGVGIPQVTKQLRVFGDKNGFFRQVNNMSLKKCGCVLTELAHIDHGMKTGGTTGKVAIERLVIKLSN
jgi:DNA polymerase-3 subunit delta